MQESYRKYHFEFKPCEIANKRHLNFYMKADPYVYPSADHGYDYKLIKEMSSRSLAIPGQIVVAIDTGDASQKRMPDLEGTQFSGRELLKILST